jgi:hypothetical protein
VEFLHSAIQQSCWSVRADYGSRPGQLSVPEDRCDIKRGTAPWPGV